jgi:hypothetical protein
MKCLCSSCLSGEGPNREGRGEGSVLRTVTLPRTSLMNSYLWSYRGQLYSQTNFSPARGLRKVREGSLELDHPLMITASRPYSLNVRVLHTLPGAISEEKIPNRGFSFAEGHLANVLPAVDSHRFEQCMREEPSEDGSLLRAYTDHGAPFSEANVSFLVEGPRSRALAGRFPSVLFELHMQLASLSYSGHLRLLEVDRTAVWTQPQSFVHRTRAPLYSLGVSRFLMRSWQGRLSRIVAIVIGVWCVHNLLTFGP